MKIFIAIGQGKKTLLRRLKNIGMASEKLYRNTLKRALFAKVGMKINSDFSRGQFLEVPRTMDTKAISVCQEESY